MGNAEVNTMTKSLDCRLFTRHFGTNQRNGLSKPITNYKLPRARISRATIEEIIKTGGKNGTENDPNGIN
jgi:hypothetical protein